MRLRIVIHFSLKGTLKSLAFRSYCETGEREKQKAVRHFFTAKNAKEGKRRKDKDGMASETRENFYM